MMALGTMAGHRNVKVKIVPVGLSYFHAHRFRSRAVIEFGPALDVSSELVERFKNGGPDKREAVSKLMDQVYDALKAVTVRAPDYDTLMVRNNLEDVTSATQLLGSSSKPRDDFTNPPDSTLASVRLSN
jgi:1-acyl-sn-glycerol-3-phosphate acyltransferase